MFNHTPLSLEKKNSLITKYTLNLPGTDYICGDIHGCYRQLDKALDIIGFNYEVDRLFVVGDLVDRGPESVECLEYLKKPWFYSVIGNHEYFAILYLDGQLEEKKFSSYGGGWLVSYQDIIGNRIKESFNKLPIVIELVTPSGTMGIVHGDVQHTDWNEFIEYVNSTTTESELDSLILNTSLRDDRIKTNNTKTVSNIDYIIHGHTYTPGPRMIGNVIYLDTGLVFGESITFLNTRKMTVISIPAIDLV